jgi:hypothetical protein
LDGRNLDPRHDPVTRILTVEFSGEKTAAHRLTVE